MTEVPNSSQDNVGGDEKMEEGNTSNSEVSSSGGINDSSKHPYHLQLAEFEPNAWQLEESEPVKYLPLEETKLTFVDSQKLLDEMMTKLKEAKELAIDLEHHSYRSFIGMVCLVQISTRTEDFIVDALTLKEELKVLNEVCTDSNILKVIHGSYADILGLQRDFGIYMVNMFDTFEAAKNFDGKVSLAHVLKENCNVEVEKKYRYKFADWRVRPLPSEMVNYAREDTHYLLYIYDIYRNKLLQGSDSTNNLLKTEYKKSAELCKMIHVEKVFKEDSYKADYKKIKGTLSPRQLECFRLLYAWRDKMAREQDESPGYTFPNKMMFRIAKKLPTKSEGFMACCNTLPPLVDQNITHVLSLVIQAINYIPKVVVGTEDTADIDTESVDKKPKEESKLVAKKSKKSKKKTYCFTCRKPGHLSVECALNSPYGRHPRGGHGRGAYVGSSNMVHNDPYGRHPRGGHGRGAYVGSLNMVGNDPYGLQPRGGHGREAYFGGYDRSGYEAIPQGYSMGYEVVRPSSNYYANPWHPYQ